MCVYKHFCEWNMFSVLLSLNMNDIQETCQKNAAAALTVGRRDVAKVKISSFLSSDWRETFSLQPQQLSLKRWGRSPEGGAEATMSSSSFQHRVCVCVCARAHVQVWALASAATSQDLSPDSDPDTETPWARHPFGRQLLETLWVSVCWTVPCTVLQWTPVSFTDHWSLWLCEKLFIDN